MDAVGLSLSHFHLPSEDQVYQQDLAWELVRELYGRSRSGLLGLGVFLLLLTRLLEGSISEDPILRGLFMALAALLLFRLLLALAYPALCRHLPDPHRRHLLYASGALLTGLLLGGVTLQVFHRFTALDVALYCVCHVGLTALALVGMGPSFLAYTFYLLPNAVVMLLSLWVHPIPGIPPVFILVMGAFTVVALITAHQLHVAMKSQVLTALRLRDAALRDGLTGLHNRRFVDEIMDSTASLILREWNRGDANARSLGLYILDIDHFKAVNDTHGHAAGDAVLSQLGMVLGLASRRPDLVARWGGEEFLLIAQDVERDNPKALAERIRAEVESFEFILPTGERFRATCSIGGACFPFSAKDPGGLSWEATLNLADAALYRAKQAGRNTVRLALPGPEAQGPLLKRLGHSDKFASLESGAKVLVIE
ncbi:MAG TPA: GGDEF domain-containing protein [Holophagaceae bacterium]|nr:GGDEF domain-containing protein [Holophagaceae bacterium]